MWTPQPEAAALRDLSVSGPEGPLGAWNPMGGERRETEAQKGESVRLESWGGRSSLIGEAWGPAASHFLPASPCGEAAPHPSGFAVWVWSPGCPSAAA